MNLDFAASAFHRLETFLEQKSQSAQIEILTPDASTREYFRVKWNGASAVACVYPEPFTAKEQTYLDVTNLFLAADLPVAEIFDFDENLGVIVQEDFGNTILRDILLNSDKEKRDELINEAISLIAKIQAATPLAYEMNSIASQLKFDEDKLLWELNFFKIHYFESFRKTKLSEKEENALKKEFTELAKELETRAEVLCHRDFHAANLMIDTKGELRIIDHQDARIGAASYDLVSLLLDRVLETPDAKWIDEKKNFFLDEREKYNLKAIDAKDFDYEFDLMTVQRCLKAIGTFSNQTANCGKTNYAQYIAPMFQIVLDACRRLQRFPNLQKIIEERV